MKRASDALDEWRKAERRLEGATRARRRAERHAAENVDRAHLARLVELEAQATSAEAEAHERFLAAAREDVERRIREDQGQDGSSR
jgi:hypothetical protein